MDKIKILVCYHKEAELPKDNIYLPIQVGKKEQDFCLGIQTDCDINGVECDNISVLNHVYCEMTAMYWAWKNIKKVYPNVEYVGLCHYRRFFDANWSLKDEVSNVAESIYHILTAAIKKRTYIVEKSKRIKSLQSKEFLNNMRILSQLIVNNDIVTTEPVIFTNTNTEEYFKRIGRIYIDLLTEIINENYSVFSEAYNKQLKSNRLHAANMIVMKFEYFDDYCNFVFGCLETHIQQIKERGICKEPETELIYGRISGYLAELLTSTYILSRKQYCNIAYTKKFFVEG